MAYQQSFLFIIFVSLSAFGSSLELKNQAKCLCSVQVSCHSTDPQNWFFAVKNSAGAKEHYVMSSYGGSANIYKIIAPVQNKIVQTSLKTRRNKKMGWIQLGPPDRAQFFSVQYDLSSGQILHREKLTSSPRSFKEDLENWKEAKRLENILYENRLNIDAKGFNLGNWLLKFSDKVGMLPATGLESQDLSLSDVIRRYYDDSLSPSLKQARHFQNKNKSFFLGCPLSGALCDEALEHRLTLKEAMNSKTMNHWRIEFEKRLLTHLQESGKERPYSCPRDTFNEENPWAGNKSSLPPENKEIVTSSAN